MFRKHDDIFTYAERCYGYAGDQFPTCLEWAEQERTISVWSHEEKLGKVFLVVRTEKHMSSLDKKVEEFSALKGFWLRIDGQIIIREGLGVCELTKLFSEAQKNFSSITGT